MKKLVSNQYFIAAAIVAVAGTVWYVSTWENKTWLAERIVQKGGVEDTEENWKMLASKSKQDLKKQLKGLN